MGGLKKHLPITFWTFLIGTLAIAGRAAARRVLLEGRDPLEDVLRAATRVLWVARRSLTAFLTATYMFRLLYLTFFGERRARRRRHGTRRHTAHARCPRTTATAHGTRTGRTCTTRRRAMAIALVVLAIGSVRRRLRRHSARARRAQPDRGVPRAELSSAGAESRSGRARRGRLRGPLSSAADAGHSTTELALMALSTLRGARRHRPRDDVLPDSSPRRADAMAAQFARRCTDLLLQQVLRGRALQRRDRAAHQAAVDRLLWRGVDAGLIDGTVNGVGPGRPRLERGAAAAADRLGPRLRDVVLRRRRDDPRVLPVAMSVPLLTLLVALPLAGGARSCCSPAAATRRAWRAGVALGISLVDVRRSACCCGRSSTPTQAGYQFVERHTWLPDFGISYHVGVDGISLLLVVLTTFLTPIALLCSWESVEKRVREFSFFMLALEAAMIGVFVSLDLFLFYVFWDAMLIPMYFLIGIWGYDRRIYAPIKFILYTMAGSVLMLIAIIWLAYLPPGRAPACRASTCATSTASTFPRGAADVALPGVRRRVRDQGAAVPVPHVAAGRARRGADRRLGHPGRRAAEDGHLRPAALRVSAVPAGGAASSRRTSRCSRSSASSTARSSRWCSRT